MSGASKDAGGCCDRSACRCWGHQQQLPCPRPCDVHAAGAGRAAYAGSGRAAGLTPTWASSASPWPCHSALSWGPAWSRATTCLTGSAPDATWAAAARLAASADRMNGKSRACAAHEQGGGRGGVAARHGQVRVHGRIACETPSTCTSAARRSCSCGLSLSQSSRMCSCPASQHRWRRAWWSRGAGIAAVMLQTCWRLFNKCVYCANRPSARRRSWYSMHDDPGIAAARQTPRLQLHCMEIAQLKSGRVSLGRPRGPGHLQGKAHPGPAWESAAGSGLGSGANYAEPIAAATACGGDCRLRSACLHAVPAALPAPPPKPPLYFGPPLPQADQPRSKHRHPASAAIQLRITALVASLTLLLIVPGTQPLLNT